jgi:hypothetical protein
MAKSIYSDSSKSRYPDATVRRGRSAHMRLIISVNGDVTIP